MLAGLIDQPGKFRTGGVGIIKGSQIAHVAPPAQNVPFLMRNLFTYLKSTKDVCLIKSSVFHYELAFIHPFVDGNGRMGRLWQTLILINEYPIFQHLPFESLIAASQTEYYKALVKSDKIGESSPFIEYMLGVIDWAFTDLLKKSKAVSLSQSDRLAHFVSLAKTPFSRKDYMAVFKNLSSASASRDLKKGIELGLFSKAGDKRMSVYEVLSK